MTSPFRENPRIHSLIYPSYLVYGAVMIIVAVILYTADYGWAAGFADIYYLVRYVIPLVLLMFAAIAIAAAFGGDMDAYYLHNGRCSLVKNRTCRGGCTQCIFALTYIQNELTLERTAPAAPPHKVRVKASDPDDDDEPIRWE